MSLKKKKKKTFQLFKNKIDRLYEDRFFEKLDITIEICKKWNWLNTSKEIIEFYEQ